ncbi:hypothetical protein PGH26_12185 [Sporosarcina jeotgali]|uniref:Uncharacterized protein n=1 Tax=Sporosarcina jeotgali TaxID=3020056 RepID=A0ABZ0KT99_9BACL|nr:hypothetical protein [Sporosarcina sp. B2O-1]WOV83634.1 hypothetical protein PGH26_12185 [Sporosarcina sp. B2O-1]
MKKFSLSLLGGGMIGIILSFLFMDYDKSSYTILDQAGIAKRTVNDMDFEFVFNSFFLIAGFTIVIYVVWTFIEKRKDDRFYNEFGGK